MGGKRAPLPKKPLIDVQKSPGHLGLMNLDLKSNCRYKLFHAHRDLQTNGTFQKVH